MHADLLASSRRRSLAVLASLCCVLALFAGPTSARAATTFTISGRGYGHGIGLSQYGAKGYAEKGWSYDRIMRWYFQGTKVGDRDSLTVKVDLDPSKAARSSWRIAAGNAASTLTIIDSANTTNTYSVAPGKTVWITFAGRGARVCADAYSSTSKSYVPSTVMKAFSGSVIASTGSYSSSLVRIRSKSGPFSESGIAWRGRIRFVPASSTTGNAIDYVSMEQYLRGVVPRESPSGWHMEALKAQAVAARSYAYDTAAAGSVLYCTTRSQVYNGASCADGSHSRHETSRTDSAISATAGKVVLYGSKVVTTYFSSSSGGRTANSKDVWFSSRSDTVSPAYYTSVEDADSDSPNYRWALSAMTGAAIADKIRAKYPSAAAPSPHSVTSVALEKGSSGFVRYVTVRYSNGAAWTIKGSEFRTAFGLKSTAFSVKSSAPASAAPGLIRYQQGDSRLVWGGAWTPVRYAKLSGGSYRKAKSRDSAFVAAFKGTSVSWVSLRTTNVGKARVYLDGTLKATVDLYSGRTYYRRIVWRASGLSSDATHTLVIRPTGTRSSRASAAWVGVDAIDVAGTLVKAPTPPSWRRSDESSSCVGWAGTWVRARNAAASGGTYRYSASRSASATLTFAGTRVRWIGTRSKAAGVAFVSIDGSAPVKVDLYGSGVWRTVLWTSPTLAAGTHTLTIRPTGTHRSTATGSRVNVDAFEVLSVPPS